MTAAISGGEEALPFTNPNGVPDWELKASEAKLWLMSQVDRSARMQVRFDEVLRRWRVGAQAPARRGGKSRPPAMWPASDRRCLDPASAVRKDGTPIFAARTGPYGVTWVLWSAESEASAWYENELESA